MSSTITPIYRRLLQQPTAWGAQNSKNRRSHTTDSIHISFVRRAKTTTNTTTMAKEKTYTKKDAEKRVCDCERVRESD